MKNLYKLSLGLLLISVLFSTNLFAQTESEPNDDCGDAEEMTSGLTTYSGTLSSTSDKDFWFVRVSDPNADPINISYTFNSIGAQYQVEIKDVETDLCNANDYYGKTTIQVTGSSKTGSTAALGVTRYFSIVITSLNSTTGAYSFTITSSTESLAPAASPGGISGANLWYKADAGVTASVGFMSKWENQGSLGTAADAELLGTQASDSHPAYITSGADMLNFNPSVKFDGSNDFIQTGLFPTFLGTAADKEVSQFIVYKKLGANNTFLWNIDNGLLASNSGTLILLGAKSDGQLLQSGLRLDYPTAVTENETVLFDLIATTSSTPASNSFSLNKNSRQNQNAAANAYYADAVDHPLRFGRFQNSFGHGIISELVIFPSSLNASDRLKVQSYLALKYGLSLGNNENAVDYISSGGTHNLGIKRNI
jgi:hypothetical protein